jgi:hypothetical protein
MGANGQPAGRRVLAGAVLAGLTWLGAAGAGPAVAAVPAAGAGGWGKAVQVPAAAALKQGRGIGVSAVSCAAAGSCAAGGGYRDGSEKLQAFVVTEVMGRWHRAIEVPGTAALNTGGVAGTSAVSCAAAGSCSAGGQYSDGPGSFQAFVVTEAGGRWHRAIEVPGLAALNQGGDAFIMSVSCAGAGSCAAGGYYRDSHHHRQAFVVNEAGGRWGTAIEVPGTTALNKGRDANVTSVSCPAAASCVAGGFYTDSSGHGQPFVVSEAAGQWGTAIEVPGTDALNKGIFAATTSVSCAAAGSCAAGGHYTDGAGHQQVFVVNEAAGQWGTAIEAPGTAALNKGGAAFFNSVSCGAAGSCAAGGQYTGGADHRQAFVVTEAGGRWRTAIEVPGTAALNKGGAFTESVSCWAAGSCAAGGFYTDGSRHGRAFVVTEAGGRWGTAIEVPGTAAPNKFSGSGTTSVSCAAAGSCAAVGDYTDRSGHNQVFAASRH